MGQDGSLTTISDETKHENLHKDSHTREGEKELPKDLCMRTEENMLRKDLCMRTEENMLRKDPCRRGRHKERIACESVLILGSYFILTLGTFTVLQYFMPPSFYQVKSEVKYNTLLLVQLLLLLNSTLNPLVHYWRNPKIRTRVNSLLTGFCKLLSSRRNRKSFAEKGSSTRNKDASANNIDESK